MTGPFTMAFCGDGQSPSAYATIVGDFPHGN